MMLSLHLCAKLPFFAQLGIVIKTSANAYIIYTLQGRFYLESKAHNYAIGDLLFVSGNRIPYFFAHIEGDFDYARYLQNQGIFSALKVSEVKVMLPSLFRYLTFNVADIVTYPRHLEPLKNVLLVKSIDYDDAFLKVIRDDDLLFLITMSGAHLSLIRRINKKVFGLFTSETGSDIISHMLLLPLFLLNITKFAFYRIFGIFVFRIVNKKKFNSYFTNLELNVLLGFLFLLLNPFLIYNAAFYLAFTLIFLFNLARPKKHIKGRVFSMFLVLCVIVPYKVFGGGALSLASLYLPFLLTPLVSVWFIAYFVTLPIPFLQNSAVTLLNFIYWVLNSALNYNVTFYFAPFSYVIVGVFLLFLFGFLLSFITKNRRVKKKISLVIISAFIASFIPFHRLFYYRLTFINVGQGDSILLETPQKSVLIDTGGLYHRDVAAEVLIPYFYRHNVYKLDYLITTHDDFDHNGGVDSLVANFRVQRVITEKDDFPLLVDNIKLFNLNPYYYGDDNLDSLIIYFSLPAFDVLLMGDAGVINEEDLIKNYPELNVDILKVGHHGSNTSTSEAFIAHYLPRVAVISVGYNNKYGHPHKDVVNTLRKYNVEVRRTDLEGTISLKSSII